jgi:hypothetical protein
MAIPSAVRPRKLRAAAFTPLLFSGSLPPYHFNLVSSIWLPFLVSVRYLLPNISGQDAPSVVSNGSDGHKAGRYRIPLALLLSDA